ncbi:hypothetical protein JD965_14395 [Bacillus siamensis]|uniref:hypothetical protein n=1 Tax=Bacillus siamensis TaxID=659243 RepID=UPI0018E5C7BE|nr:hypothetical protein [Bacillus siamensis]QQD81094.1 hypothetical protein JD965_14395 [Bacillus siamensis]
MDFKWLFTWMTNWINDNIPEKMQPAILTSATTLIGAFIGACVAQYFSHRLGLKREKKSNQRIFYNELFAPILLKMYTYCDYVTEFNKRILKDDHPIDENQLLCEINDHIGKNLKYASPKIINAYNKLKQFEYVDDMLGKGEDIAQYHLFEEILNELIKIAPYDRKSKKEISKYRTMYFLLKVLTYLHGKKSAAQFLECRFIFKKNKLYSKLTYKYLSFFFEIRYMPFVHFFYSVDIYYNHLDTLVKKKDRPFAKPFFKVRRDLEEMEYSKIMNP